MLPANNYFFAEGKIIDRIAERIPDVFVDSAGNIADLLTSRYRYPGVYVIYAGQDISGRYAGNGAASQAHQYWNVAVGVRDAESLSTGRTSRAETGKLLYKMLTALQGYEVAPGIALVRISPRVQPFSDSGLFIAVETFQLTIDIAGG